MGGTAIQILLCIRSWTCLWIFKFSSSKALIIFRCIVFSLCIGCSLTSTPSVELDVSGLWIVRWTDRRASLDAGKILIGGEVGLGFLYNFKILSQIICSLFK